MPVLYTVGLTKGKRMTKERDKLFRTAIFDEIDTERKRQDLGIGHEFDDKNTPNDWVTFVVRYVSRSAEFPINERRTNMLKAAAICVAALEAFDRAQGTVPRHYE